MGYVPAFCHLIACQQASGGLRYQQPILFGEVSAVPRRRRERRVESLVQPLLFDFPREEKAVGANKIGPASSPRSYLHVIPSPSDDN